MATNSTYYNEHDPFAAAWLRELIADGLIPAGYVDERSIEDVTPDEIAAYNQCHFFAGIGGWPLALRLAGWPDDRPVWTGSAPCQPFSAAGKGGGFADERHLWPSFLWFISKQRPAIIFGEQVASKAGRDWFDVVSADLEAHGYAVGAADLCAAGVGVDYAETRYFHDLVEWIEVGAVQYGLPSELIDQLSDFATSIGGEVSVGAPHIRQRLYFVADSISAQEHKEQQKPATNEGKRPSDGISGCGVDFILDNSISNGQNEGRRQRDNGKHDRQQLDANGGNGGFWSDLEWLPCTDGKAWATKPGLFPLAHGFPNRVGILRGAGNAIVPPLAAEFVGAYLEARE